MRIILTALILAVGVLVGAAVPAVSGFVQGLLISAGLPPTVFNLASGPTAANSAEASPGEAGHAAGDGHGHGHGKPASKPGAEQTQGEHDHSEAEGEEGHVKMTAEQIENQDIKVAKAEGAMLSRHILVPGTITPDTDRIARVPARVVGTVAEMRKRLGDAVKKDEVVAVLDSREVADSKSEYLTASVKADLEKTNFERQQALWDKRISAESAFWPKKNPNGSGVA